VAKPRFGAAATLLYVETCGLVLVLYLWLLLYRRLLAGPGGDRPGGDIAWKVILVAAVMQACYWGRRRPPRGASTQSEGELVGHVLLFVSRLSFVFVGSSFSLFIVRVQDTRPSAFGVVASIWTLFAIFCYVLELEQMARPRLDRWRTG
jgi:hypothetical protein